MPPRKPAQLPKGYCYRVQRGKRSETIYQRSFAGGTCRYTNTGCTTLDALAGWIANHVRERELAAVGLADPHKAAKNAPLGRHLDDYLSVLRETSRYPGYPKEVGRALAKLFVGCKATVLRDLTPFAVQTYLGGLTCSAATKNKTRSYLFSFCKWLVEQDRLAANPVERVKAAKAKAADATARRQRRAYTLAELRALVTTAATYPLAVARRPQGGRPRRDGQPVRYKSPENELSADAEATLTGLGRERQLIYRVWLATGLRRGELSRVTVGMFDPRRRTISLPGPVTKNGRPAVTRVPAPLAADLSDFLTAAGRRPADRLLVVPDARAMSRLHQRMLMHAGVAYRTPAGFADVHALRKTANSFLRRSGVAARLRQRFLRHAAADLMTAVYDDERGHELRPVVRLLAKLDTAVMRPATPNDQSTPTG